MMWRRKKSLVNPRQQVFFGLELIAVVFGFNILCAYFLFIPPMSEWFGGAEITGQTLESLSRLVLLKWPLITAAFLVLFVVGIVMSHRFAGPIFGLMKVLDAWRSGDFSARVRFRRYDYLITVMKPLNDLLDAEQKKQEELINILNRISQSADTQAQEAAKQALEVLNRK